MAIVDGQILKAVAEFVLLDGTIAQNVFYFLADFLVGQADNLVVAAIDAGIEALFENVDAYVPNSTTVNPIKVDVVAFDDILDVWYTFAFLGTSLPGITFTSAADPMPNQIAAVLVANTNRPKTRGRKFLPPFVDVNADASEWVTGVLTDLALSLADYLVDLEISANNVLVPGVIRTGVDSFQAFTSGVVNSICGTQRRRKPGVGF